MAEFRPNEGSIFLTIINKQDANKPVGRGSFTIGDVVHEVALWPAKNGKAGSYSGKVKVKEERAEQPAQQTQQQPDDVDQIPF